MVLSSASQIVNLSASVLRDILSSLRAGDVHVSSGLPGVSGPSVSLAVTSSSDSRIVPDVRPSYPYSTPVIPVAPFPPVSSSSVPSSIPPSDFPLLGSFRTGESFPLLHVLCSSSGLPFGQLNPFELRSLILASCVMVPPLPYLLFLALLYLLLRFQTFPLGFFWDR